MLGKRGVTRLKKELLKMTSSEASFPEADSSKANIPQRPRIVDKVQCTESTTTMFALVPATTNSAQSSIHDKNNSN